MSFITEFDTPPIFEQELAAESVTAPVDDDFDDDAADNAPVSLKSPGDRARSLIANKERFKVSPAQRTASLAYAALEQAEATDRQTAVLERQAAAQERQNILTERLLAEQRMHNQLRFYGMTEADFTPKRSAAVEPLADGTPAPDSVWTQFKRNLGIIARTTVEAPALVTSRPASDEQDEDVEFV
jgi:hypothetical protein